VLVFGNNISPDCAVLSCPNATIVILIRNRTDDSFGTFPFVGQIRNVLLPRV